MMIVTEVQEQDIIKYIDSKMGPSEESDYACRQQEAIIPRLDKKSFEQLQRVLESHSGSERCWCEHDCCGCAYGWGYSIKSIPGDVKNIKIVHYVSYNY